jgi:hypothetical protein
MTADAMLWCELDILGLGKMMVIRHGLSVDIFSSFLSDLVRDQLIIKVLDEYTR